MSADDVPSVQLLAAMRQEVTRQLEAVQASEIAALKRRVDELEAAVHGTNSNGDFQREGTGRSLERSTPSEGLPYQPLIHQSDPEEEGAPETLPESLFTYCVERLALSDRPWREPAVGLLLFLTASQNFLMTGFSQMNFKVMVAQHWDPYDQRPKTLMSCIYADVMFMGEPVLFLLVVLVALVITSLVIKTNTESSLHCMYPDQSTKTGVWVFVNVAWFQQMVFVPAIFSVEAAALFSGSTDTSALIMNTLAVTFILEVDNILYCSVLSDSQKAAYQGLASHPGRPRQDRRKSHASWFLFWCHLLLMCVHFLAIRVFLREVGGRKFILATLPLYLTYVVSGGLRGAVQIWAARPEGGTRAVLSGIAAFVVFAVATPSWFMSFAKVSGGGIAPLYKSHCYDLDLQ